MAQGENKISHNHQGTDLHTQYQHNTLDRMRRHDVLFQEIRTYGSRLWIFDHYRDDDDDGADVWLYEIRQKMEHDPDPGHHRNFLHCGIGILYCQRCQNQTALDVSLL